MKIGCCLCSEEKKDISYRIKIDGKPNMRNSGDSYWDTAKIIFINNSKVEISADMTWGDHGYFEFEDNWYKVSTENWEDMKSNEKFKMVYF